MVHLLQADANLKAAIVHGVRRHGPREIDFKRAEAVPLTGVKDPEVLAIAAREERVLVSHDQRTLPRHLRDFTRHSRSPGVILVPKDMGIGLAIERILLICATSSSEELQDSICLATSLAIYRPGDAGG
jgi:predicted nuclease of predicted toxin-antitoxin system